MIRLLTPFLSLIWGLAVVAVFGGHELAGGLRDAIDAAGLAGADWLPVGPWFLANAVQALGSILLSLTILGFSAVLGDRVTALWLRGCSSRVSRITGVFAGYAVLSLSVFGVAATGLCYRGVLVVFSVTVLALLRSRFATLAVAVWTKARSLVRDTPLSTVVLALFALAVLPRLLLPEHNEDCLMYHLSLPQQLLVRHRLPDLPGYWHWTLPLLPECPNVFAVGLGLDAAVRLTGIGLALAGAAALALSIAPRLGGAWPALLGLAAFLVPADNWFIITAKNDVAACGFALAAAACCIDAGVWRGRAFRGRRASYAAFMAGCAVTAKYTLAPAVLAGGILALFRMDGRSLVRAPFLLASAAAPLVPWVAWSWMRHADPVHPFGAAALPGLFGAGGNGEAIRVELQGLLHRAPGALRSVVDGGMALAGGAYPVLAALPVLAARRNMAAWWAVAAAVTGTVLTALVTPGSTAHLSRFVYPALVLANLSVLASAGSKAAGPPASLAAVGGALGAGGGSVRFRRVAEGGVAVLMMALLAVMACRIHPRVTWQEERIELRGRAWLAGRLDSEAYRRSLMGSWGDIQPMLTGAVGTGRAGRVLVVGGKFWGVPGPVVTNDLGFSPIWSMANGAGDAGRVAIRFRQAGIRWVTYDAEWGSWDRTVASPYPWTGRELRAYADCAKRCFKLAGRTRFVKPGYGMQWLYEVDLRSRTSASRVAVLPGADAAFGAATMAEMAGDREQGLAGYRELCRILPDVSASHAALGHALVKSGHISEGYMHLRIAAADGLIRFRGGMLQEAKGSGALP